METDVMTAIQKIILTQVKETGKDRVLEFIGSTEVPDRDGEVIKADAWQFNKYSKNPVVQWAHRYDEPPIGKTLSIRQNSKRETIFEIEFANAETYEFADTIFKLCKGGFLSATSVGFIPLESEAGKKESDPHRIYTKVELLEISIVPVPSNPDSLITARNAGLITIKEFEWVTKPEETEEYIRIPIESSDKHKEHRIRTIDISAKEGIKALYCGECKVILTYLFDKSKDWTMEKAKKWVEDHKKSAVKPLSQEALKDEFDFIQTIIDEVGINEENKPIAIKLAKDILRLTGSDIPAHIEKAPIRGILDAVIKSLEDHHLAHNKCHEKVIKALGGMVPEPDAAKAFEDAVNQAVENAVNNLEVNKNARNIN